MTSIGKLIESKLKEDKLPVTWLAYKLNCDRTNVYRIFKATSLDTNTLLRISQILRHNFFKYYEAEYHRNPHDEEASIECLKNLPPRNY